METTKTTKEIMSKNIHRIKRRDFPECGCLIHYQIKSIHIIYIHAFADNTV